MVLKGFSFASSGSVYSEDAQKQEKRHARTNVLCCVKRRQYLDQLIHGDIIMFAKASVRTRRNRFRLPETIQGHTHGIVKKKIHVHVVDESISLDIILFSKVC